jgi:polyisoprenoid-binding protein YceI
LILIADRYLLSFRARSRRILITAICAFAASLIAGAQLFSFPVYKIDPGRSTFEIYVFRGGLFKSLGHDHLVAARNFSGTIHFDPAKLEDSSVSLSIESNSLAVLDPEVPEKERNEVQATMEGPRVLDVQKFPRVLFNSTRVGSAIRKVNEIRLTGRLNLHGSEKEIAFPVSIVLEKNLLRATGTVSIPQSDFGIVPIKLAGGTVRVKDEVKVTFTFLAEKVSE